jgi:putative hydrolase of the HAD superfamily
VLFDLGGVVVELNGVGPMQRLSGLPDEAAVWSRWLASPWVRRYERGGCTSDEFVAGLIDEWELAVEPAAFVDEFVRWPTGLLAGAQELVAVTRQVLPVGCLSNTNPMHWADWSTWGLSDMFDHRFLSFELDLIKPDREIFDYVVATLGVPAGRVLFMDDNLVNVKGAQSVGLAAHHVRGVAQAAALLREQGVLSG